MMIDQSLDFHTLIKKGHTAFWDLKWEDAVASYNEALENAPENPRVLSSLGLAYFQSNKYEAALKLYRKLSKIDPENPMPYERIGRIYERVGMLRDAVLCFTQAAELQLKNRDVDKSIDKFNDVLRLDAENQNAHLRLARIYEKLGKKPDAVTEYIAVASLLQNSGQSAKALQIANYASQLMPESQEARKAVSLLENSMNLPLPEKKRGGTGPMRMAQLRELEAKPGTSEPEPHYDPITEARMTGLKELASLLFDQSDDGQSGSQATRRAIQTLTRGTGELTGKQADLTRIQVHLSQAIDLQTSGHDEKAAIEMERALDLGMNRSAAHYVFGLLIRQKDPQKALKHLQRSARNLNYTLASYLLIAEIYENAGKFKDASMNYLQALKLADAMTVPPQHAEELMQLYDPIFESHTRVTQEKDLQNLCTVISAQLTRPDWRDYLKAARAQMPQHAENSTPLPIAEMLMESTSSLVVDALSEVKRLASAGMLRTAMEEAYHAISFAPTYLPLHVQIGEVLIAEGRIPEAVEKFQHVSRLYTIRGETAQAIRLLGRVTKLAPMEASVRISLINLLKSAGRQDEAIQQSMELGNIHYQLGELTEAQRVYQEALALSRHSTMAKDWSIRILNKLSDIEIQSLNWKQATQIFEQLRSLQPMESSTRATLIDLYFRMGLIPAAMNELDAYLKLLESENLTQEAEQFLDDLLKERPENSGIQKRMAGYYISHDELNKAIEKLDVLAERMVVEENKPGAVTALRTLIALNPPNKTDYERLAAELEN